MRRIEGARVNGPYEHGQLWRCRITGVDGARRYRTFETRAEAEGYAATFRNAAQAATVRASVDAFVAKATARGRTAGTVECYEQRLALILNLKANGAKPLRSMLGRGNELYARAQIDRAPDTHRNALSVGRAWGKFCVTQKWLKANPFADVEPVGRKRRGADKPQLRLDEARRLDAHCRAHLDNQAAICVLAALLLGCQVSEIVKRDVRDLDDSGNLLWIDATKTEAGRRRLKVPPVLRDALVELAGARPGTAPLFVDRDGKRCTRHWALYQARKLYRAAGVPVLDMHALRRTQATLATDAGATGELVAAQLGHETKAITQQSYIRPDSTRAASSARSLKVMQGGLA